MNLQVSLTENIGELFNRDASSAALQESRLSLIVITQQTQQPSIHEAKFTVGVQGLGIDLTTSQILDAETPNPPPSPPTVVTVFIVVLFFELPYRILTTILV